VFVLAQSRATHFARETRTNEQGHSQIQRDVTPLRDSCEAHFLPDFQAVFHSVDRKLVSFMEVTGVTVSE
jgi:hypothetical protein